MKTRIRINIILSGTALMAMLCMNALGAVITFDQPDGDVLIGATFGDSTNTFRYSGNNKVAISSNALRISTIVDGRRNFFEEYNTIQSYNGISSPWGRSLDVTLHQANAVVSLVDTTPAFWQDYASDITFGVFLRDDGTLRVERENKSSLGSFERYNFTSGSWGTTLDTVSFDVTHTLNIAYLFDPTAGQFSVAIMDQTAGGLLATVYSDVSDMNVVSTDNLFLVAGDPFSNSINQIDVTLDNVSTAVPEPASIGMLLLGGGALLVRRRFLS